MITFTLGGMTGVMLAIPGADFVLHNSLFLIAHFHNVIIGGVLFGYFAGFNYWFPKVFGFKLNEKLGQGVILVLAGRLLGRVHAAVRARLHGHDAPHEPLRQPGLAARGCIFAGSARCSSRSASLSRCCSSSSASATATCRRIATSRAIRGTATRWNGRRVRRRAVYNFAIIPDVRELDAFAEMQGARPHRSRVYRDIHMPSNTIARVWSIGLFSLVLGFAAIWHIWWLAIVGLVGSSRR